MIRYQVRDARARHEAARSTFAILDTDLMPQAQRNFDAAYASYAAGQGDAIGLVDALRSYLDVRLDRIRALVHLTNTAADLARATGEKASRAMTEPSNHVWSRPRARAAWPSCAGCWSG